MRKPSAGEEPALVVRGTPDEAYVGTIYGQQYLLMDRAIAAGMNVSGGPSRAEPLSAGAVDKARPEAEAFLAAIGHSDDHHHEIEPSIDPGRAALAAAPRFYRTMGGIEHLIRRGDSPPNHLAHCGWWWCQLGPTRLQNRVWTGLARALKTLRRNEVDPWTFDVALVGSLWHEMGHRAFEKKQYEAARAGLTGLLGELDGMSDAARVVRTALIELEPLLANVSDAEGIGPKGGGRKDAGRRAALEQAEAFGWPPAVVAAISVLVAADLDGLDNFDALTAKVGEAFRRLRQERDRG